MKRRYKLLRTTLIVLFSFIIVVVVGWIILSRYVERKVSQELESRNAKISSFKINLFTQSVSVHDFEWTYLDDSLSRPPHHLTVKLIHVDRVNIYQLVRQKKIQIHKITINGGDLQFNRTLNKVTGGEKKEKGGTDLEISVDSIVIRNIKAKILYDSIEEYAGTLNIAVGKVAITDIQSLDNFTSNQLNSFEALVTNIQMNPNDGFYKTTISRIYVNSDEEKILVDSILILPKYSKYRFSRKIGRQVDRFSASIPAISFTGVQFDQVKDSIFKVAKIEINSTNLHVYRDKRLPFKKEENTPLPIAMIRSLPFEVSIDSVKLTNTTITYEEFPEDGFQTGQIRFEKLNATLDYITNRNNFGQLKQATLRTSAKVMGRGLIKAEFSLPFHESQIYNAKGSIRNLSLFRLNPILENLAFVSIETGTLNQLDFNFDYDDIESRGLILINYENLKINSLTKEKETKTNAFKSLLINTFIRKDKGKGLDKDKRTGVIYYKRDRKKAIFNVWVKSLFSGLKSSVLDSSNKKETQLAK